MHHPSSPGFQPEDSGSSRLRSFVFTFTADDEATEVFSIVLGSVAENFRGIHNISFESDDMFEDQSDLAEFLYNIRHDSQVLSKDQLQVIEDFTASLNDWELE